MGFWNRLQHLEEDAREKGVSVNFWEKLGMMLSSSDRPAQEPSKHRAARMARKPTTIAKQKRARRRMQKASRQRNR